jgi:hypothetical protein
MNRMTASRTASAVVAIWFMAVAVCSAETAVEVPKEAPLGAMHLGGANLPEKTIDAPSVAVEIQLNVKEEDTADNDADDYVCLTNAPGLPSIRCRAKLEKPLTADITVVLVDMPEGGEVRFPRDADTNKTLRLKQNGTTWTYFDISGVGVSSGKDDAKIEAREGTAEGKKVGEEELTVITVEITPAERTAIEGLDSATFTCAVTPTDLSPTYTWLTGADNGAWPATAGNSPELNYSAGSAGSTRVKKTKWFAKTPSSWRNVDNEICYYHVNCGVTIAGVVYRAVIPAKLSVAVINGATTENPAFQAWETITVAEIGGVWKVTGQGGFSRSMFSFTCLGPETSQFRPKTEAHENKHSAQWSSDDPWQKLFDANALYSDTLSRLTGTSDEELRSKIDQAVKSRIVQDNMVAESSRCDGEYEARTVELATPPLFLNLPLDKWKLLYNCEYY